MRIDAVRQKVQVRVHLVLTAISVWVRRTLVQGRRIFCALWQLLVPPSLDGSPSRHAYSLPDGILSPCEVERLIALRQRFLGQPEYLEFEFGERRLIFARWLVEHGQLNEFPVLAGDLPLQGDPNAPREPTDCACRKHEPALVSSNLPGRAGPPLASLAEHTRDAGVSAARGSSGS